jgi:hypothetical protein
MSYVLHFKEFEITNWIRNMYIDTTHEELKKGTMVFTCQLNVMTKKCKRYCETFLHSKGDDKEVKRGFDGKMVTLYENYCLHESSVHLGPDLFTCNTTYIIPGWNALFVGQFFVGTNFFLWVPTKVTGFPSLFVCRYKKKFVGTHKKLFFLYPHTKREGEPVTPS